LTTGVPLYVTPAGSLYALKVADACRRSAETGQTVYLE
jgi:biliverdin reductase